MKLFVTGANGFVGSAVVAAALEHGHDIVAMVRDRAAYRAPVGAGDRVEAVQGDLRHRSGWEQSLAGCDAVIHLAAAFGDFHSQFASTVIGTERLLQAMDEAGVTRLVHISTFSIYDYRSLPNGSSLDETSPLEAAPQDCDEYTRTKLVQEQLVRDWGTRGGLVTIIRPGAVYGPGKLWDAGLTTPVGAGVWLAVGPGVRQKLTYVENCADAIVLAVERDQAIGRTINIVDDDPPTQREYAAALRRHGFPVPTSVPVPFAAVRGVAAALHLVNTRRLGGRLKLPWFVVPVKLDARFKQFDYPNAVARDVLGWSPRYSLDQALDRVAARSN